MYGDQFGEFVSGYRGLKGYWSNNFDKSRNSISSFLLRETLYTYLMSDLEGNMQLVLFSSLS